MYLDLYKNIVSNALAEKRQKGNVYYETHHIVPDFMFKNRSRKGPNGHLDGDPNSIDNMVLLTFQEHLMAHYYLYEICKGTRYEYQSGTSLQFFFVKAGNNHIRQRELSEVDVKFLNEMAHLRELGIASISAARTGKMPAVDAATREKVGSVPINHPKVISGEWIHHSKGKPGHKNTKSSKGSANNNYKPLTKDHLHRLYKCALRAIVDDTYISRKKLIQNMKEEFTEFKKISEVWISNHLGGISKLVEMLNEHMNTNYVFDPYYRSKSQRQQAREYNLRKRELHD